MTDVAYAWGADVHGVPYLVELHDGAPRYCSRVGEPQRKQCSAKHFPVLGDLFRLGLDPPPTQLSVMDTYQRQVVNAAKALARGIAADKDQPTMARRENALLHAVDALRVNGG